MCYFIHTDTLVGHFLSTQHVKNEWRGAVVASVWSMIHMICIWLGSTDASATANPSSHSHIA